MATGNSNPKSKCCTICEQEKELNKFAMDGGRLRNQCRQCRAAQQRARRQNESPERAAKRAAYSKEYAAKNKEAIAKYKKEYATLHADKIRAYHKVYYTENADAAKARAAEQRFADPEGRAKYNKEWAEANKEKMLGYSRASKARRRKNPIHRVHSSIGSQMRNALKTRKGGRRWESIVGYTLDDLVAHLERQFTKGISWDNYGTGWHIDHIVPQAEFDMDVGDDAVRACWALTNLRPLCAIKNASKGAKRYYLI